MRIKCNFIWEIAQWQYKPTLHRFELKGKSGVGLWVSLHGWLLNIWQYKMDNTGKKEIQMLLPSIFMVHIPINIKIQWYIIRHAIMIPRMDLIQGHPEQQVTTFITRSRIRQYWFLLINSRYLRCQCSVTCFNLDKSREVRPLGDASTLY